MRRFFIEPEYPISRGVVLTGADANHLVRVLRLKPGARVVLFDGSGKEWDAVIDAIAAERVQLSVTGDRAAQSESPLDLTIAQGFLKERKMDNLVRQMTELGVARWVPYFAARSIARPAPQKLAARMQRWERIVRESLKQCRRSKTPVIGAVATLDDIPALAGDAAVKIVFWEAATDPLARVAAGMAGPVDSAFVLLGPEGGLAAEEVDRLKTAGFVAVSLGPRILKAETAAVAACALVQHRFGDL
jgi:16S rRNA (uracil1498-N3)-methyltransferase